MKVLIVKPGKRPYEADIDGSLESMQAIVGGYIEVVYPFDDPVALVCMVLWLPGQTVSEVIYYGKKGHGPAGADQNRGAQHGPPRTGDPGKGKTRKQEGSSHHCRHRKSGPEGLPQRI